MKQHKLFWGSSYDRGLDILLEMWPQIKKQVPDATLDICYGWDLFDVAYSNNKERQEWKKRLDELMKLDGITHHGRVGRDKLKEVRSKCGIWSYPTYFTEINCITALECQNDGLVPVTMTLGALKETAKKGILIDGDITTDEVQKEYLDKLVALMKDKDQWKSLSKKCKNFAKSYDWNKIASSWQPHFAPSTHTEKVTVYTPTIRDGFWNVMAGNLATQTHKNFEWLIVDGQEKSREKIAQKYAKDYDLDIKYIHQGKTKRTYGLSQANNIAIDNADGYLFVFLQDFVLLPATALEELLTVSKKHPGDFIAPVDQYFSPKIKPNTDNKEDWFDGETDIVGEHLRTNVRVKNEGIRIAQRVTDFEQNYGAVPLATLKHLNGYWEFYDEALGWDDTEIIYRGKDLGYDLWIDDTNQCVCIDHWGTVGNVESGVNRSRRHNDPRFVWMVDQMDKGNLPIIRDPKIEKKIDLQYTVPESVTDDQCSAWVRENSLKIATSWSDVCES